MTVHLRHVSLILNAQYARFRSFSESLKMLDFGEFCYLDTPKTGSQFVSRFLMKHSALPLIKRNTHSAYRNTRGPEDGKFFFSTVRHPFDTYISLYAYGCDGRGKFRHRLEPEKFGKDIKFSGDQSDFVEWLSLITSPSLEQSFGGAYTEKSATVFGPITLRFLRTNMLAKANKSARWGTKRAVRNGYSRLGLPNVVLRTETLNDDLSRLVDHQLLPFIKDPEAAKAELSDHDTRINASKTPKQFHIPLRWKWRIRRREWFLFEKFYR